MNSATGKKLNWKRGRGKLGIFKPLLGSWHAETQSEMGPVVCDRMFSLILGGKFVQLDALWQLPSGKNRTYEERAIFGPDADGQIRFWSCTNDGKRSEGWLSGAEDIHAEALCFEADMPAGRARQVYWPHEDGAQLSWAVESRTKKGWNRFVRHDYRAIVD